MHDLVLAGALLPSTQLREYIVVGALEERLPASPYWKAEWQVLGEGS